MNRTSDTVDKGGAGDEKDGTKPITSKSDCLPAASTSPSGPKQSDEIDVKAGDVKAVDAKDVTAKGFDAQNTHAKGIDAKVARAEDVDATRNLASDRGSAEIEKKDDTSSEMVAFKITFNKQKFDVSVPLDSTIEQLKNKTETLTGIPPLMQKLMFRGLARDHQTLRELKVTNGAKIMVVGSTLKDVQSVTKPVESDDNEVNIAPIIHRQPMSLQPEHRSILDKYGKPADALPSNKNIQLRLPLLPLTGMYNRHGSKVRLSFKVTCDQMWIATREKTEKIPLHSIQELLIEAIEGHEDYLILAIQFGPTEASRYWIYWVPAQYEDAITNIMLGRWQSG